MIPIPPAVAAFAARRAVKIAFALGVALIILGLVIALTITRSTLDRRTEQRDALQQWQNGVLLVVARATNNRAVRPESVFSHIANLAINGERLRAAVATQNAGIARARADGEARLRAAREASAAALRENAARERVRRGLLAPGRTDGLKVEEWSQL